MTALDKAGADRIAPFVTLWDSYNGIDCNVIAGMFKQAAALLEAKGYDRYSKSEDETSAGLTIFEALESVARLEATGRNKGLTGEPRDRIIELDTNQLADELATRLAGVLIATGQVTGTMGANDLTEVVWAWTRNPVYGIGGGGVYRGQGHAVRLLEVAAMMTLVTESK